MKILLFGITNVGKSTIGKMLSKELNYNFDDIDDEIKKKYKTIDIFKEKYPSDYERHMQRGNILKNVVNKYKDNVVIAVSSIFYEEFFNDVIGQANVLAIELQDSPENILERLVYADENDEVHPLVIKTKSEKDYYLKEIKEDIKYYKRVYKKIENKFDMQGEKPEEVTKRLLEYIKRKNVMCGSINRWLCDN